MQWPEHVSPRVARTMLWPSGVCSKTWRRHTWCPHPRPRGGYLCWRRALWPHWRRSDYSCGFTGTTASSSGRAAGLSWLGAGALDPSARKHWAIADTTQTLAVQPAVVYSRMSALLDRGLCTVWAAAPKVRNICSTDNRLALSCNTSGSFGKNDMHTYIPVGLRACHLARSCL